MISSRNDNYDFLLQLYSKAENSWGFWFTSLWSEVPVSSVSLFMTIFTGMRHMLACEGYNGQAMSDSDHARQARISL